MYAGEAGGFRQLFVRTLATGDERRLTHSRHDDIQPAWSPDGQRLAFVQANTAGGKLEPSDINGWYFEGGDIWNLDLSSGKETKLVDEAFGPAWSPDGSLLAFDARWGGPRRIWVADARGRNPRQITADSNDAVVHAGARWSPDGTRLVFRRIEKTKADIAVADLHSSSATRLTDDIVADMDPAWAPNGRYLLFSSTRTGKRQIWMTQPDGSNHRQVTSEKGGASDPAWGPLQK